MIRINQLKVPLDYTKEEIEKKLNKKLFLKPGQLLDATIIRESLDARKKPDLYYNLVVDIRVEHEESVFALCKKKKQKDIIRIPHETYTFPAGGTVQMKYPPVIVGTGPAGLFCGYYLAKAGYRPIIIEQGEPVERRAKAVEDFWEKGILNPYSNVQFGEGGAGTFSDGKLNTSIKDKAHRSREILKVFVEMGADPEILYKQKPHVGTDVLREIVKNIRTAILSYGGQVRFCTRLEGLVLKGQQLTGIRIRSLEEADKKEEILPCEQLVLAIGHSSRETFSMLHDSHVPMEAKSFAVGFRVEHPQSIINESQLAKADLRGTGIKAADYKLTAATSKGRGVYSFCMCPGGYVINASSEEGGLTVNGMSYRSRNGKNANSAIIVSVTPADFPDDTPLGGVEFQRRLEKKAYELGKGKIPLQLYGDFKAHRITEQLGDILPEVKGAYSFANVRDILPEELNLAFMEGMEAFQKKIPGFSKEDVPILGIEARTSSPLRILRNAELESDIKGIYPCGEGAGYAGGITSAAIDGLKVAEAIVSKYEPF
ncbi:MAG: FAD-dependent oxidoreductase [Lachnospiraceae bacterium]|nr:FAD-dependent oxidoreductase [Lachnospiraceae bacterium]